MYRYRHRTANTRGGSESKCIYFYFIEINAKLAQVGTD